MLADEELRQISPERDSVLTIGVFDGVHLGHRHLISETKRAAEAIHALSGVVTFRRHPIELLDSKATLPYLTGLEEKLRLIRQQGVDFAVALTFDENLASLSAEEFVLKIQKALRMRGLVVGPDFALGRNREGNVQRLESLGKKLGFFVVVVPPLFVDGELVSSTAIRRALSEGDMLKVVRLTGRPYLIKGKVVSGTGQGRKMGFPTANLEIEPGWAIPKDGVYATMMHINGDIKQSMTNIGLRPTVEGKNRTIETYVLDYEGDLYGREVSVDIVDMLREEKKFPSIDALKKQIARDVERGKTILKSQARDA
jgi:riboflavin kinase/FMN adenylyltransferase